MDTAFNEKIINCFYETTEDCVKVVDTHGILMSFNDNGYKIMEIDNANDVIGKSWINFWKGDLRKLAEDALTKAVSGEPAMFEGYCPTFKGKMKFWKVSLVPIRDDSGAVASVLVTSHDATKLIQLEERVHELENRVQDLQRN